MGRTGVLSTRLDAVGFSEIAALRNEILERRARGESILQFEGGEPFPDTPDYIKDACREALARNQTRYPPTGGLAPLKEVLVEKLQRQNAIPAAPSDVIVVNGSINGLFAAFHTVVDPGDEIVLFSPYWTPVRDMAAMAGARLVTLDVWRDRGERLRAALEARLSSRSRCLYLNTPQNPTGAVFCRAEIEAIADVARRHDLVVVADEAYEDLIYGATHVSIAALPGMFERTITCFSFSKSFAMTGWRLGYVVAAEPFQTGLRSYILSTSGGVSTPVQWAGVAAIRHGAEFLAACRVEYEQRRNRLVAGLNALGFRCDVPHGTFFAFPDARRFGADSRALAERLLRDASVACVPGSAFGPGGEGHLRFSFAASVDTIDRGLDALRRTLGHRRHRSV